MPPWRGCCRGSRSCPISSTSSSSRARARSSAQRTRCTSQSSPTCGGREAPSEALDPAAAGDRPDRGRFPDRRGGWLVPRDRPAALEGGRPRHPDRRHTQRDRRSAGADARSEEGREDPRRRPLPADEGDAGPGRHGRDPARAEPGRRRQRHHLRADHALDDRHAHLGLPRDSDHGRVPGQLLRPLRLSLPAAQPRRHPPGDARRDRSPLRDRRGRLRGGTASSRLPADPRAPRDRRVRLRDRHRADRRPGHGRDGCNRRDGRHRRERRNACHPAASAAAGRRNRDPVGNLMAKKVDPKAKAKRQKIFAAIGGVILLGLLAFQVPRTMKMLHPAEESSTSSTPAATTTAPTSPIAAPSLAGGNATAAAAPGGDGLVDADAPPAPQSGQLLAFGLFRTKDPFKQQLEVADDGTSSGGATPSTGGTGSTGAKSSAAPTGGGAVASSSSGGGNAKGGAAPTMRVTSPAPGAVTTAEIAVNGVAQSVQVGGVFPSSDPFFKLVKLTRKGAQISIAGGSLANGAPMVMLTKTKPLTLQNTSDGTRYVLRLLSVS